MDKPFRKLARLVGRAAAEKWVRILSRKRPERKAAGETTPRNGAPPGRGGRHDGRGNQPRTDPGRKS